MKPIIVTSLAVLFLSACSSAPRHEKNIEISADSPTVVNARAEPSTVVLNGEMQPVNAAQVLADVKDFKSHVTEAHLKFSDVPLDIPMENVGGTTWRAELTPQQLQALAVSGKTVKYQANVTAKDANGNSTQGQPISISVKAPDYAHQFG